MQKVFSRSNFGKFAPFTVMMALSLCTHAKFIRVLGDTLGLEAVDQLLDAWLDGSKLANARLPIIIRLKASAQHVYPEW
ncbi:hypothetical protein Z042_22565 [Chania multitudinisentens RB-25]|uniref:Uncharacterized protein n=1 Tax=Chania multitudinisentens RB-25 TaxID=1441930 RepID=W0LGK0_9GAMM|nr:hypothetical protein [Chania multitudinisentens]AHG22973.1 hypothetical protein Z042_22565 [Chania multitudinisentens RB-25]